MKDLITQRRVALLHPKFIPDITAFIDDVETELYLKLRVVQGFRTFAEQEALYALGRTKPGEIVTYSIPGTSYHNYGVAVDCVPYTLDGMALDWNYHFEKLRPYAIKHNMDMGLDFPHPDPDHFQNKYGIGWREMRHRYDVKDFIPNTQFIRL